eukprot:3941528-Rhodomonas_salina.4
MSSTVLVYDAMVCPVPSWHEHRFPGFYNLGCLVRPAICLRTCYAMSGTELAYAATCLRACYAVCVTELAYGATRIYAMCGTDIG